MNPKPIQTEKKLKELMNKYYSQLCVVSVQYTDSLEISEDIVQDVFVRFWEENKLLSVETNPKAYLFRSIRNASIDYIRKNNYRVFTDIEEANLISEEEISEEELSLQYERLYRMIGQLSQQERAVLNAIVVENKRYKEVAEEMNISVNTVKTYFARALRTLRKELPLSILLILLSPK
ncbi:MAG: sigma-70 family RNA polymerase sigma factor [Bacteroidales bacterium]|nr:sigma-70 family RNA polymerase sigma factor [Bacteroidales bacterium]